MEDKINIDIGKLTEPVTRVVDVIDGAFFEAGRTVSRAKAEAEGSMIAEVARQNVLDIQQQRELQRLLKRERWEQENLRSIGEVATKVLNGPGKAISPDWAAVFRDSCKNVSDEEMRILWGKLLAGELAKPGSFSPRTMNALRLLLPEEARAFNRLCSYAWLCDDTEWFIFKQRFTSDFDLDFPFDDYIAGIDAGLVLPSDRIGQFFEQGDTYKLTYGESTHFLSVAVNRRVQFPVVKLTSVGNELAWLSHALRVESYYERCLRDFADNGFREAAPVASRPRS
jgi:hypothetical protein